MKEEDMFQEETAKLRQLAKRMEQEKPQEHLRTYNTRIRKWDSANWLLIIPAIIFPPIISLIIILVCIL